MKRLLGYLKEHLCVTILAPLFKMLEASFELFVPLVVASMIDVGIGHHDIGYLWNLGSLDFHFLSQHSILRQDRLCIQESRCEVICLHI